MERDIIDVDFELAGNFSPFETLCEAQDCSRREGKDKGFGCRHPSARHLVEELLCSRHVETNEEVP